MTDRYEDMEAPLNGALLELVRAAPREREASELLEERTVRALRERGVLRSGRALPRSWYAAGVAASIALFACGVSFGQWMEGRHATAALAAQQQQSLEEMAQLVERTGSEYVSALSRIAESNLTSGSPETAQARQAALQILHQAANEMVRMAPNDPVATRILQGLDHAALQQQPSPEARERRRQIIWY